MDAPNVAYAWVVSIDSPPRRTAPPPARALQLLANFWLPAAIIFGLTTAGLVATTVQSLNALVNEAAEPGAPVAAFTISALLSGLAAAVSGRITWRLSVEVPHLVRAWNEALTERNAVSSA